MKVLGIDPGLHGALCIYNDADQSADIFATPTVPITVNGKVKNRIDYPKLAHWLELRRHGVDRAVIEQVGAMRNADGSAQGVTSAFAFGETFGAAKMLVAAAGIPFRTVLPQAWKSAFGLLRQDKSASRTEATRQAPHLKHHWPLVKDDGKAESFLIALYGARFT